MIRTHKDAIRPFKELRPDCSRCFGYCCVALYFSETEGFPEDKAAGKPCAYLNGDFRCTVHGDLAAIGLRGCISYDCLGAGQKVAMGTYGGKDWWEAPELAQEMFTVFSVMKQLNEMLWYLTQADHVSKEESLTGKIRERIRETEAMCGLTPAGLLNLDIITHREKVNRLLREVLSSLGTGGSGTWKNLAGRRGTLAGRLDLIGADLKGTDIRGADLGGALLMGADLRGCDLKGTNLIAADLRGAQIQGAQMEESLFLTPGQVTGAVGDARTGLPPWIGRPEGWSG